MILRGHGISCGLCSCEVPARHGLWRSLILANLRHADIRLKSSPTSSIRLTSAPIYTFQPRYLQPVRALRSRENRQEFRSDSRNNSSSRNPSSSPIPDVDNDSGLPSTREFGGYTRRKDSFGLKEDEEIGDYQYRRNNPGSNNTSSDLGQRLNKFVLGGLFVLGMGAGIAVDTVLNVEPNNVASREVIDRQTPNPDVCIANGMSAMVLDQRLFITFNPFNVYVSQAEVKPGCVLLQSNWRVLESRGLVNQNEVRDCKRNFNTFGFVGDLRQAPEINCVYHSESAENQFLKDPTKAALGDGFQPKDFPE